LRARLWQSTQSLSVLLRWVCCALARPLVPCHALYIACVLPSGMMHCAMLAGTCLLSDLVGLVPVSASARRPYLLACMHA
jgi:hypothetical protein